MKRILLAGTIIGLALIPATAEAHWPQWTHSGPGGTAWLGYTATSATRYLGVPVTGSSVTNAQLRTAVAGHLRYLEGIANNGSFDRGRTSSTSGWVAEYSAQILGADWKWRTLSPARWHICQADYNPGAYIRWQVRCDDGTVWNP